MMLNSQKHRVLFWIFFTTFIIIYPLFLSLYPFLPLFIGAISYLFVYGVEKRKLHYPILSFIYMVNMEINVDLPLFLMVTSAIIIYILFHTLFKTVKICPICRVVLMTFFLDLGYIGLLFIIDFIFNSHLLIINHLLIYSLILDIFFVVFL